MREEYREVLRSLLAASGPQGTDQLWLAAFASSRWARPLVPQPDPPPILDILEDVRDQVSPLAFSDRPLDPQAPSTFTTWFLTCSPSHMNHVLPHLLSR
jgi:hypothetical protein